METKLPTHQQIILDLACHYGLESVHPDTLEQWFQVIKYFDNRFEPPVNVMMWYAHGLQSDMDELLVKLPNYSRKEYDQKKIDSALNLMKTFNRE